MLFKCTDHCSVFTDLPTKEVQFVSFSLFYVCLLAERWEETGSLREARAYASTLVLPDGRVWIAGGLGKDKVLQTSEYMVHDPTSGVMTFIFFGKY